jgi:OOP family OmpA-OmpF porin
LIFKRNLILFTLTLSAIAVQSQNLVINPGFETYNEEAFQKTCKLIFRDDVNVPGWSGTGSYSSAAFHQCSSKSMYLSSQKLGVKPHSGKWMIGFTANKTPKGNDHREYIIGKLSQQCKAGVEYKCSFYLSPRDGCDNGVTELAAAFSAQADVSETFNAGFSINPQLVFNTSAITEKGKWYKIEAIYTAAGNEQYITIGNFNNDTNSVQLPLSPDSKYADHWNWYASSFYFIDDVEVI